MIDNQPKESKRIFGLDFMRAIPILVVLLTHTLWIYPKNNGLISQLLSVFGFLSVEVFFVLSGFLIGKILFNMFVNEPDFSFHKVLYFLKRRWFRTLPNYYLVLFLNILLSSVIGFTFVDLWKYFFFLQNFSSAMSFFFPESWSIAIEEFAYLLFPILLLLIFKVRKDKNKSRLFFQFNLLLILIIILLKVIYNNFTTNTNLTEWNISLKGVVLFRLDAIFIGILFSWLYMNYETFWIKKRFLLASIGFCLMTIMFIGVGFFQILIENYPFFWNVLYLPITSVAIACFLPLLSCWETAPKYIKKPITFISKISYSIYLLHYSIILQLMKYLFDTSSLNQNQLHLFMISYLTITFFMSWILYRFYEKPMMNKRDKIRIK